MSYKTQTAEMFAQQLKGGDVALCIDVRTEAEFAGARCLNSINIPLQEIDPGKVEAQLKRLNLPEDATVHLICQAGKRSIMAAEKVTLGLANPVCVVSGGVQGLSVDVIQQGEGGIIPLERQVLIAAGSLSLLGVLLGFTVGSWGFFVPALVGAGLVFAGLTDTCFMGMLLARMPWNKKTA
ncbi:rhodanese-like domain-containing protein [Aestuariicella hydrocarbonica]|uniref:Rhodanese-like domain-containing protein n=1 Tax=Pseudomaricurvus hydrocarbonicus TaxID=1470433 RepID=A0A9E5MIT2_9GAMM|nr:rhodanese-like domain-containing protein [Aestuariicella hydrocarbonica]NHO63984.1 rhodanese-like domain-containing protein [Aestuariicella hydrocarbonica]